MTDRREVTCRRWRATFFVLASLASLTWAFAGVLNPGHEPAARIRFGVFGA